MGLERDRRPASERSHQDHPARPGLAHLRQHGAQHPQGTEEVGVELGLGIGDPRQIKIVGYDIEQEPPWNFVEEDTLASKGQKLIYHGPLKPLEKVLLQSPLVPWSYFASNFYHNVYWYPFVGRKRVESALDTRWGKLFANYGDGQVVMPGMEPKTVIQAAAGLTILAATAAGLAYALRRRIQ